MGCCSPAVTEGRPRPRRALAAPRQDAIEAFFGWLGEIVAQYVTIDWLAKFLSEAIIGGVGGVLVFLPQIALLFAMIALLEGVGYMSRAAFLMDRERPAAQPGGSMPRYSDDGNLHTGHRRTGTALVVEPQF